MARVTTDTRFTTVRDWEPPPTEDLSALVRAGQVTAAEFADVQDRASRTRSTVADILLGEDRIPEVALASARAEAWGIEPIPRLERETFDVELVREREHAEYLRRGWLPVRRLDDGSVLVATFIEPVPELRRETETELGAPVTFAATTRWEFRQTLLRLFADRIADEAANDLGREDPLHSAQTTLSRGQSIVIGAAVVILIVLLIIWPLQVVLWGVTLMSIAFLLATAFKFFISLRGSRYELVERIADEKVAALVDDDLPVYTVLVPVFREANIVGQLLDNIGRLDYPKHKLEVLILV